MPTYITHEQPVLRNQANYIAQIDLAPYGFPDTFEQVWLRGDEADGHLLCCLPFRAYGVALHDRLRLDSSGGLIVAVVRKSGHRILRALLARDWRSHPANAVIMSFLSAVESDFGHEWSGDRHIAVDIPVGTDAAFLVHGLEQAEQQGAVWWEWSDAIPFAV